MEIAAEDAELSRQSGRQRVKTAKALDQESNTHRKKLAESNTRGISNQRNGDAESQDDSDTSETEDAIQLAVVVPGAPRPNRTKMNPHLEKPIPPTRNQTGTTKTAEKAATSAAAANQQATEKANTAINPQIKLLTDLVTSLLRAMEEQKRAVEEHKHAVEEQKRAQADQIETLTRKFTEQNDMLRSEVAALQTQLSSMQTLPVGTPSYADIARTPPSSQPSNLTSLPSLNTTSAMTDTLYCTVDTSRVVEEDKSKTQPGTIRQAIEQEIRTTEGQQGWRCMAVTKDPRNTSRVRITCRDEAELQQVKETVQKIPAPGVRVLRDQLYPVKIDNANRTAILNQDGTIRAEAAEALGKENNVRIAKLAWLSRKDTEKAYGSMVVYVTKGSDGARLLQGQYFHVAGESAYTRVYELRSGPRQCYRCQELGHKAFACTKQQVCAKCAQEGHHHSDCREELPKCVPCGGPHESFSKNCPVLYPTRHA